MSDPLLDLQALDLEIDRLEARRKELESGEAVAQARAATERLEARLGELRLTLDEIVQGQTKVENDVAMIEQKLAAEEKRMYDGSIANPKELEALQAEIANAKQRKARFEDDILAFMERREELEAKVPSFETDVEEARRRVAELESSSETELEGIGAGLEARRAARGEAAGAIDGELLDLYEDLRAGKKGVAAVLLEDGVCQGCHEKLSPMELDAVKKESGLRRCPHCRRIVVLG